MPFSFPLETLLRLQRSYERKERMRLEEIANRIARVKHRLEEVEHEHREAARAQARDLASGGGLKASEMHFAANCEAVREDRHRQLSDQLVQLHKEHRAQQVVYLEARQKREILEKLREGQYNAYRREWNRREQRSADELFLARLHNRKS